MYVQDNGKSLLKEFQSSTSNLCTYYESKISTILLTGCKDGITLIKQVNKCMYRVKLNQMETKLNLNYNSEPSSAAAGLRPLGRTLPATVANEAEQKRFGRRFNKHL
jgi:hypothetical protein